ncbi:hypothetical protein LTR56_012144 [Elasticomyces elasticus]|nr:hypothetical protein LTR56_012144 [Elasticomyces elasticus]KAK3665757.1 hypothetical protein LTR22_003388 [Elasticomyces elasticus]KAK4926326.1 hypothetical protein LTR49_006798 [Elasticomyces elasticus]KAK5757302.1 hypothetical protein LTS12_012660 [Elasticomyces elasticus]
MARNSLHDTKGDDWNALAAEYVKISHQTTIPPIGLMLERANALYPLSKATAILDNGCGPGPVMERLIKDYGNQIPADCELTCSDFSDGMLEQVQGQKDRADSDSPWKRVNTKIQNAMDLTDIPDGSQTHVTAGMVYFMVPDPQKALAESLRVLKPDGVLSLSAWEGSEWMDMMNLLPKIRPDKVMPAIPRAWMTTDGVKAEMEKAGFRDVETHQCPVEMPFQDHETFADFFIEKLPHMRALIKDMSEEEVTQLRELMVSGMKKQCPNAPGALKGIALVGVGRK